MPYDNLVQRGDVAALVPEEISTLMLTHLNDTSAAMSAGLRINVPTSRLRFPVLSALPIAYWVGGDTGLKKTTTMAWKRKFIQIEEIACLVPLPDGVQEDLDFDIWAEIQPAMESAIARALDAAIFFGDNKPESQPQDLAAGAIAAGNVVQIGTNSVDEGALAGDVSDLIATLEDDGYIPDAGIAEKSLRGLVRKLNVGPITTRPNAVLTPEDWYGTPISYPARGLWPAPASGVTRALIGDFKENLAVGVRSDFNFKIFTEGVVNDDDGAILFNLMQQDMSVMRLTFRAGFQIANPINYDKPDESERYPFAVLQSA